MLATMDRNWRIVLLRAAIACAVALLQLRIWRLQVVRSSSYQEMADANRYQVVEIAAPRGVVYDNKGQLLVRNVPTYNVSVVPGKLPKDEAQLQEMLSRLSQLLGMPVHQDTGPVATADEPSIMEIVDASAQSPYQPATLRRGVDQQVAFLIEEEHLYLPGVLVEAEPRREYLTGSSTSHVLGYIGPIPAERSDQYINQASSDYALDDQVGLMGVEATFEGELRGTKGLKHIEVDAYGREVGILAIDPPVPGHSLVLSLDLDLQRAAESALREAMFRVNSTAGVIVAMQPSTGAVLAMVSLPSYDNNLFSMGISVEAYTELSENPERPLVNHAISGQYPPGSTFKVIPAAAALQEKVITSATRLRCEGKMLLPNQFFPDDLSRAQTFVCWTPWGHGSLSIVDAIAQSCDIYFYQVGGGFEDFLGLGIDRLGAYARLFGLGEPSGITLPGEAPGLVPDDRWKRLNYGEAWVTGDTYNAVIGQGYVLVTPLQLLNATAAIANGGQLLRPQVVDKIVDAEGHIVRTYQPDVVRRIPIGAENLQIVREGMRYAVTNGTAHRVNLKEVAVAGKTGTAEYPGPRDAEGNLPTHAWFTAFAPYEDPEIAIAVFVSGGHEGAKVAVPIAAKMLRHYFGLPQPPGEDIVAPPPGD